VGAAQHRQVGVLVRQMLQTLDQDVQGGQHHCLTRSF
jgi:hypothetical protein